MNPLDEFLSTLASQRTVDRYRAALEEFVRWYAQTDGKEPNWPLLTAVEIKDYLSYLQGVRRLSPANVNLSLAAIRSFLRHLRRNVKVKGPKQITPPVKAFSARELGRLFAAAEGSRRDTAILNLLARAGLRVGEVVRRPPGDVEINGRSGWITVKGGKGNKTRRLSQLRLVAISSPLNSSLTCTETFDILISRKSRSGGTGRRARLKIAFRKECGFDSHLRHCNYNKLPMKNRAELPRGAHF